MSTKCSICCREMAIKSVRDTEYSECNMLFCDNCNIQVARVL